MRLRLLIGATVAASAAAVALLGGVFGSEPKGPPETPKDLVALGFDFQQRARELADPSLYPQSERALARALELEPANAEALYGLAALAASRHRFDESLRLAHRARRLNPHNAAVWGLIGDANLELGRYEAAFAAFDRQLALRPTAPGYARVSYARELLGDAAGAAEAMELAVDAAPPTGESAAWARVQRANLDLDRGRLRAAERRFREALVLRPRYASATAGLAAVRVAEGRLTPAASLYRRALAMAPVPDYAVSLGDVLDRLGRSREASVAYERAEELEALFAAYGGRNQLETAMFDLNHDRQLSSALARAREGYRLRPSIEGEHVLAWALYKNGRCAEAKRHSVRALRLGTPDLDAIYHRALIEGCLGNFPAKHAFLVRLATLNSYYLAAPPSAFKLG